MAKRPTQDPASQSELGRRERQIMEIVYRRARATAAEVLGDLADPPSYSAVRGMLRYLEEKGHLKHEQEGPRYVYLPTAPQKKARASALSQLVHTFFDGSASEAAAALIESKALSRAEHKRLVEILEKARKQGMKDE
ncbi:MAG: BlaI/MecI/CopY family transcriptional regulator [Terricaulis sp.]